MSRRLQKPIVVCSFPRSGTHVMMDLIRKQFPACKAWKMPGQPLDHLYCPVDHFLNDPGNVPLRHRVYQRRYPILKTHYMGPGLVGLEKKAPELARVLRDKGKWIYMIRHPEAVARSNYTFHLTFEDIEDADQWLLRLGDRWVNHVRQWGSKSECLLVDMHEVLADPSATLDALEAHLHLDCIRKEPLLPKRIPSWTWGRVLRFCAVTSESTEIMSRVKIHTLEETFSAGAVEQYRKKTLCVWNEIQPRCGRVQ